MAIALTMFLLLAPHDGHVFGGQPTTLTLQRVAESTDAWAVRWALAQDDVVLREGESPFDQQVMPLTMELPQVRAMTPIRLICRVVDAANVQHEIATVERTLTVYPPMRLSLPQAWLRDSSVVLVTTQPDAPLAALFAENKLALDVRLDHNIDTLGRVRLLIVDQGAMNDRVLAVARRCAERGASVLVFMQSQTPHGPIRARPTTPARWRLDHPLLAGMGSEMLDGWAGEQEISLPWRAAEGEAFVVGGWPHPEDEVSDLIDGLLVVEHVGAGVIVHCQLPVEDWRTDPRARWLLGNALVYLESPPPKPAAEKPGVSL